MKKKTESPDERTERKLALLVEGLFEKKARDVTSLRVTDYLAVADHFLIATVDSAPQARAVADHLDMKGREAGMRLGHMEGEKQGVWVLLDFGDVVVHLFQAEARALYDLEGLWFQAEKTLHTEGAPPVVKAGRVPRAKTPGEAKTKLAAAAEEPAEKPKRKPRTRKA